MIRKVFVLVAWAALSGARAEEVAPAAETGKEVSAPAEAAPAPAVAQHAEETVVLTGRIESRTGAGGDAIRLLIEKTTGKRWVLPSHPKQLPANFTWGAYPGEVSIKALLLTREKNGKTQVVVKRILELNATAPAAEPAPAAAAPAPEVAPKPES